MKFLVAVDLEGVACAYGPLGASVEDAFNVAFVRKQATREADAAVRALFDSGATEVIVWDNHGRGCSLEYDELDPRCDIAIGSTVETRYPGLDSSFAGVVLIGYHAMASEGNAALAHTFSSKTYQYIKANGVEIGEVAFDAAAAGRVGVPVIFASGDNYLTAEAKRFLPWIETVETKRSYAFTRIISKHPKRAAEEIYQGVKKAAGRLAQMQPFTISEPVEVEIRFQRTDVAKHTKLVDIYGERFESPDAFTRKGVLKKLEDLVV